MDLKRGIDAAVKLVLEVAEGVILPSSLIFGCTKSYK